MAKKIRGKKQSLNLQRVVSSTLAAATKRPTKMSEVSFNVNAQDRALITAIVERAWAKRGLLNLDGSKLDLDMDITAVHANGCPLDLERWLSADNFNFAHDIVGIRRHIDRNTAQLMDFFIPRFARSNQSL
jgi:hypothetical protein